MGKASALARTETLNQAKMRNTGFIGTLKRVRAKTG